MSRSFYNFGMATTETPAQIKANYVRLMGPRAGEAFAELMQDAARLHLKWNEFLALFAVSPAQIETMNRAAPGFFYLVSEAWWDGIILYIFRLTDHNKKATFQPGPGQEGHRRRRPRPSFRRSSLHRQRADGSTTILRFEVALRDSVDGPARPRGQGRRLQESQAADAVR